MQLPIDLLLDDNMKSKGIYERHYDDYTTERRRCLADGTNWLWVYLDGNGNVEFFAVNDAHYDPKAILDVIAEVYEARIYSEDDPDYYGLYFPSDLAMFKKHGLLPPI